MMREKIASIILDAASEGAAADAIIAALPDMIPDLHWVYNGADEMESETGYSIIINAEDEFILFGPTGDVVVLETEPEAKATANTRHKAAVMAGLGVAP